MGTSPKSSFFATIGPRTSTQRQGSATGNTMGKHNGETKRETTWVEVLGPIVAKNDDLGLVPIFKKNVSQKSVIFHFFLRFIYRQYFEPIIFLLLFIFLCCFPLCFPVVLPHCIPRCTTLSLGRSPRANRCEKWWLRTCAHLQKKCFTKICDFPYFPSIYIQTVFWTNYFSFTFHFSLLFPALFPRCASPLYSPLHYPVVGSKSSGQSLRKMMT